MYRTCLYCTGDLGSNDVLETLPVGRRIAFDAGQGRLWVICRECEKWNLVPFDTRLETIDRCDRLFAEARMRYSTGHIGIARLPEGLDLVRVGDALRPEFAAWRYGDQFGKRRRIAAVQWTLGGTVAVAAVVTHHLLFPVLGASGSIGYNGLSWAHAFYRRRRVAVHIPERDGVGGSVSRHNLPGTEVVVGDKGYWGVRVVMHPGARGGFVRGRSAEIVSLSGAHATDALGVLLPRINRAGGSRRAVRDAAELVDGYRDVYSLLKAYRRDNVSDYQTLKSVEAPVRLALEMSAHETSEQAALDGELKLLERRWKEADDLARIADQLAVSDEVEAMTEQRKI